MSARNILWIDGIAVANIEDSAERILFILRDDVATHLTIWSQGGMFRFECSSTQPVGSVWDEARVGIARDILHYKKWQNHANYFINRSMDHYADSDIPLVSFSMPRDIKPIKSAHRTKPGLNLFAPAPCFDLSLYFSPSRTTVIPHSVVFEGQIGRLIINAKPNQRRTFTT